MPQKPHRQANIQLDRHTYRQTHGQTLNSVSSHSGEQSLTAPDPIPFHGHWYRLQRPRRQANWHGRTVKSPHSSPGLAPIEGEARGRRTPDYTRTYVDGLDHASRGCLWRLWKIEVWSETQRAERGSWIFNRWYRPKVKTTCAMRRGRINRIEWNKSAISVVRMTWARLCFYLLANIICSI